MLKFGLAISLTLAINLLSFAQGVHFRSVGGGCEGCEAVFEHSNEVLASTDTLPLFEETSPKIKISGTVLHKDGITPAEGVLLYVYHTNREGIYPKSGNETGLDKRHGYIRGWIKTDQNGRYEFYTFKPGTYPSRSGPAHIHLTILEPNGKYYWVESYYFSGDPLMTDQEMNPKSPRGGSKGVLNLSQGKNILTGTRDIILGKNISGYE